ncbi:MAG TPA: acylphosphatase [Terriglobales bacterium]|nr:acylphosphatase [Terriglobales bacterium]
MQRVSLVITGHVQGVGFRWYVQRQAQALGLSGEVGNRSDGAVLIEAEGGRHALEQLLEAAREGPMGAVVRNVEARWSEGPGRYQDFHISH